MNYMYIMCSLPTYYVVGYLGAFVGRALLLDEFSLFPFSGHIWEKFTQN